MLVPITFSNRKKDVGFWNHCEKWIWSRPQSETPTNLEQLTAKLYEYADLCNQPGTEQQQHIYNTYYGVPDPNYNNQRRGGMIGRFFLAAQNGGEALDGVNSRKERHQAELPPDWNKYPGQLLLYWYCTEMKSVI